MRHVESTINALRRRARVTALPARLAGAAAMVWVLAGVTSIAFAEEGEAPRRMHAAEIETQNIESRSSMLRSEFANPVAQHRLFATERRFIDATLAYERGNYAVAAVMFMDLVESPLFRSSRDYYRAVYLLADSLYRKRNFFAARQYYGELVDRNIGQYYQEALQKLIAIAVLVRRDADVDKLASRVEAIPVASRAPEVVYQIGKSYFQLKREDKARSYLMAVPRGTRFWAQAHFYLGVMEVGKKSYKAALQEFGLIVTVAKESAASADDKVRVPRTVLDYTHLAMGRVQLELKKYQDAILSYQMVDRNALVYENALFEMAATYVVMKEPKKALESLEVLLLTVSDDHVAVEASVLRGQLNLQQKEYNAADVAYKDVVDRFSIISGELANFAKDSKNLETYFQWLLNRGNEQFTVTRPVSERASRYIERDEDLGRVVSLFDDMGAEKRDVKEASQIAAKLDAALKSGGRLDMFPNLRDGWIRIVEVENQVVVLSRELLEILRLSFGTAMTADEKDQLERLRVVRKSLEDAFARAPATVKEYSARQVKVDARFGGLTAEISMLQTALASLRDQILALEKMLNEHLFGDRGVRVSKEREAEFRQKLAEEKEDLRRLYEDIESQRQLLEVEAGSVGAGDRVTATEQEVRRRLLKTHKAEQAVFERAGQRVGGAPATLVGRAAAVRARLDRTMDDLSSTAARIDETASAKLKDLVTVLEAEKRNLTVYQQSVRGYEDEARQLARAIGYELVRRAQARLAGVVLEADLGLVNVAWQRKQDKAKEISELQTQKGDQLKVLDDSLKAQLEDEDDDTP